MSIDIKDVDNLADLARISISEDEKQQVKSELDSILGYISEISNVDTNGVKSIFSGENVVRDDLVLNGIGDHTEKFLENAPSRNGDYLEVDQVL